MFAHILIFTCLSRKYLLVKSPYPESLRFLCLWGWIEYIAYNMELGRRSSVLQCEEKFNDGVKGAQVLRKWGGNNKKEKCSPASRSTFSGEICKSRLRALNISFAAAFFLRSRRSGSLRLTISAPDHLQSFITKPMQTTNRQRLSVYGADAFCEIGFGDEKKRALHF